MPKGLSASCLFALGFATIIASVSCRSSEATSSLMVVNDRFPEQKIIKQSCGNGQLQRTNIFRATGGLTLMVLNKDICERGRGLSLTDPKGRKVMFLLQDPKGDHNGALSAVRESVPEIYRKAGWEVHKIDILETMSSAKNPYGENLDQQRIKETVKSRIAEGNIDKATLVIADHGNDPAQEKEQLYDFERRVRDAGNDSFADDIDPRKRFPSNTIIPAFPHYMGTTRTDVLMAGFAEGMREQGFDTEGKKINAAVVSCFSGQLCEFLDKSKTDQAEEIRKSYGGIITSAPSDESTRKLNANFVDEFAKLDATGSYDPNLDSDADGKVSLEELSKVTAKQNADANSRSVGLNIQSGISVFTRSVEDKREFDKEVFNPEYPTFNGDLILAEKATLPGSAGHPGSSKEP